MKKEVLLVVITLAAAILLPTCTKEEEEKKIELPSISTLPVTDITTSSAKSGGIITNDGGGVISSKGLVWSTSQNPTLAQNSGRTYEAPIAGDFQSTMTELAHNKQYFVRAYVSNTIGTVYGNEEQFQTETMVLGLPCPDMPTVTDIDGNVYNTVLIGNQCWMKENLKTTSYRNGTSIEYPGNDNDAWENNITGAYAWFDNANSWKDLYGALYNWHAVNSANGICPAGWHVPSHDEWKAFTDYLGGDFLMNVHEIKSCRQVNSPLGGNCTTSEHPRWNATDYGWGTDEYGFSGLPGGYRTWDGFYFSMGISGYFWSSTENSSSNAGYRLMINESNLFIPVSDDKRDGRSIRCVRDY